MPVLNTNGLPTLLDQVKRTAPGGAIDRIIEQLTRKNPILEDMVWQEGNLPTGHRFTSRTSLPSVGWRMLNQGITPGKSTTDQVDEACGLIEAMSVVDTEVAKLNGNEAAFRASEDLAFLQSLNNEVSFSAFYASTKTNPERIMGLTPRLDLTTAPGGSQIIKCHASAADADQSSIWLVCWGPEGVFGITPKGMPGGLESKDMGEQLWDDGTGKKFIAYVSNWKWRVGLCVRDWRQVVRIANVDTSLIASNETTVIDAMVKAYYQIGDINNGRPVFYVTRRVAAMLQLQARNMVTNSTLTIADIGGRPVLSFLGIPIRVTDALLENEAVVS